MTTIDESLQRARVFIQRNGHVSTACKAGLTKGALRRYQAEDWNPTADTLRKVLVLIATEGPDFDPSPSDEQAAA